MELAELHITAFLRQYAFDQTDIPYRISPDKMNRINRVYVKKIMLQSDESIINEMSSIIFSIIYLTPFYKANEHRKQIQSQKNN